MPHTNDLTLLTMEERVELATTSTDINVLQALTQPIGPNQYHEKEVHLAVAKNPHTAPSTLAGLPGWRDEDIEIAVVLNPNTSTSSLQGLTRDSKYPSVASLAAVALERRRQAPMPKIEVYTSDFHIDFAELERSVTTWTEEQSHAVARAKTSEDPNELDTLVRDTPNLDTAGDEVRYYVATNKHTSKDTLHNLAHDERSDEGVLGAIARNPNTTPETLRHISQRDVSSEVKLHLAYNPHTPEDVLDSLVLTKKYQLTQQAQEADEIAQGVARNPSTSRDVIDKFYECNNNEILKSLAGNRGPYASHRASNLYAHPNTDVRNHLASNPSVFPETLHLLATDENWLVRMSVIHNPSTSTETLTTLTQDTTVRVREAASDKIAQRDGQEIKDRYVEQQRGQNTKSPVVLDALSKSHDSGIRSVVACNPLTAHKTLLALSKDVCSTVRSNVAYHPHTRSFVLEQLAEDTDWGVRLTVARNPNTPPETLKYLAARHPNDVVLVQTIAQNPSTPTETLLKFVSDTDWNVRKAVAQNTQLDFAKFLELLVQDDVTEVRNQLAKNPNTSVDVLNTLARDKNWAVRLAVADHESLLPYHGAEGRSILERLSDPNTEAQERVRKAARERLAALDTKTDNDSAIFPSTVNRVS